MREIDILEDVLSPECWMKHELNIHHRTKHSLYGKPYGDDSDCKTCESSNALCDNCDVDIEHSSITCVMDEEKEYNILVKHNIPMDIIKKVVDEGKDIEDYGYYYKWPSIDQIKNNYPDVYLKIIESLLLDDEEDDDYYIDTSMPAEHDFSEDEDDDIDIDF